MKKRVRVYKPGGQANQPTQEQIITYIAQRMQSDDYDGDVESLKEELIGSGIDDDAAEEYIAYVSDNLGSENNTESNEEAQAAAEEQARVDEEQALLEQQQAEEEAAAKQEEQNAMYDTGIDMSTTEDTPEDEESYMQYGGSKPSKRSFINKYTKLVKKQMGGDATNHTQGPDTKLANQFLSAVANTAQDAILKQEAEQAYNSIYGTPQVGAFENGGINPEQIDTESPLDHWTKQSQAMGDIFKNNQNIQNDMPHGQFGGFTDTNSGLYRFIGGGDNESADEEYQDADIDFNQESYQMGGFRMPRRSGRQYVQAVNSPYYTATGEAAAAPDLVGRQVTSVDVTKRGIFGRPKAYTVNYGANNEYLSSASNKEQSTTNVTKTPPAPGEYTGPDEFTGRRQPLANFMMRTGIPGVRGLGAKMIKSGPAPVVPNVIPETFGTESGKYNYKNSGITVGEKPINVIPETQGTQRFDSYGNPIINTIPETYGNQKYDFKNNPITNPDRSPMQDFQYKPTELIVRPRINMQMPLSRQDFLIRRQGLAYREYGGPIDYTEYAYGGDIAIPELYKAQNGAEQTFDPNKNNLGDYLSFKAPEIEDNETFAPPTEDNTIKPLTKEQELLKYQRGYNQQLGYVDPKVAGESISGIGTTDNPILQKGTSQDYQVKRDWDKTRADFDTGLMAVNAGLDIADQVRARNQENQMLANVTPAESNYGISSQRNKGYDDPNSGDINPLNTGFKGKYGGVYAMGGNTMDEDENIRYMTQAEIDEFRANGGELEYL